MLVLAAGPHAPRGASAGSHGRPPQTEAEKTLSALLQHLRIPHVVASPAAVPGGIYRIPVWFPEQSAALELEQLGDRLAGGGLSGTARLRRRQLREAGLKVLAFDPSAFRGASQLRRLRAVAEVVAPSCPEAGETSKRSVRLAPQRRSGAGQSRGPAALDQLPHTRQNSRAGTRRGVRLWQKIHLKIFSCQCVYNSQQPASFRRTAVRRKAKIPPFLQLKMGSSIGLDATTACRHQACKATQEARHNELAGHEQL
eukprot:s121_g9.t1